MRFGPATSAARLWLSVRSYSQWARQTVITLSIVAVVHVIYNVQTNSLYKSVIKIKNVSLK